MTNRALKIKSEIEKRIWANGGHYVELQMKNGDVLTISRRGQVSFEMLANDSFNVILNHHESKRLMHNAELASVANWIDETYK